MSSILSECDWGHRGAVRGRGRLVLHWFRRIVWCWWFWGRHSHRLGCGSAFSKKRGAVRSCMLSPCPRRSLAGFNGNHHILRWHPYPIWSWSYIFQPWSFISSVRDDTSIREEGHSYRNHSTPRVDPVVYSKFDSLFSDGSISCPISRWHLSWLVAYPSFSITFSWQVCVIFPMGSFRGVR